MKPVKAFLFGSGLAVLIWLAGLIFLNSPQCPSNYTQQQIDASSCVVGANIGLGLVFLTAIVAEVITIIITLVLFVTRKKER
jgi:hypothetical protein